MIGRTWAYVGEEGRDLRIDLLRGPAVLAMVIDHHRQRIEKAVPRSWSPALLVASGSGFVALVALYCSQTAVPQAVLEHLPNGLNWSVADLEDWLFAKGDVRPGRVLASAVIFG